MTLAGLAPILGQLSVAKRMSELIKKVHVAVHGVPSGSLCSIGPVKSEFNVCEAERM